jgi:hypothetical protein
VRHDYYQVYLGQPKNPQAPTPEQEKAREWYGRERGIDDSIKNADSDHHVLAPIVICPSGYDALLVEQTERVLYVGSEWWDPLKPRPFI